MCYMDSDGLHTGPTTFHIAYVHCFELPDRFHSPAVDAVDTIVFGLGIFIYVSSLLLTNEWDVRV